MSTNPNFALLNLLSGKLRLLRLPSLAQVAADTEQHIDSWIRSTGPMGVVEVLDDISLSLLHDAFSTVNGSEGTIWLTDCEERNLVAVHNSGSDATSLVGFKQPIGSGIISLVYSQQQPYCENDIQVSAGHDDTLDRKIAKHTRAMIAVPFYFNAGLRGVISCVQLEENHPGDRGFTSSDVQTMLRISTVLERLINECLLSAALGLHDA